MKRFSEQLKKKADSIRMRTDERRELRERLVSYMEYHPLPESARSAVPTIKAKSQPFHIFHIDAFLMGRFVGAFALLFLVIVPVVAEKAIPGDVLYPVKVRFNEEIRSTLSFSPYQKVEWETTRLERRISEARLLASSGKLTPEMEANVAEAVKSHSDAAQKEIASIRQTDSEEAAIAEIAFASALEVQSEVLEGHIEKNQQASTTSDGKSIAALAGAVGEVRANIVVREGEKLSYQKLLARIESETTRAYEYFDSIDGVALPEEKQDIERRLSDIQQKVDEAIKDEADQDHSTSLLAIALADTRKLISFMTNIDVRENVTIEDLVPVTLNDEEKVVQVTMDIEESNKIIEKIKARFSNIPGGLAARVTTNLLYATNGLSSASSSLASGHINEASVSAREALAIVQDLDIYTKAYKAEGEDDIVIIDKATTTPSTTATSTKATTTSSVQATSTIKIGL